MPYWYRNLRHLLGGQLLEETHGLRGRSRSVVCRRRGKGEWRKARFDESGKFADNFGTPATLTNLKLIERDVRCPAPPDAEAMHRCTLYKRGVATPRLRGDLHAVCGDRRATDSRQRLTTYQSHPRAQWPEQLACDTSPPISTVRYLYDRENPAHVGQIARAGPHQAGSPYAQQDHAANMQQGAMSHCSGMFRNDT